MPELPRVCVIVNSDEGKLGYSETFLKAHIAELPLVRRSLVGNPGNRRSIGGGAFDPLSQSLAARATRKIARQLGVTSLPLQDTASLVRYFRHERIDVVLAEYGPTAVSVLEACCQSGIPLVAHFHGWDAYQLPRDARVLAGYRRVFESAAVVVGVSKHMVRQLIALGAPENRTLLNTCGVNLPDGPAAPATAPPRFVAVGRFTPKKAPFATLVAFADVKRRIANATLEMVGDGPLLPASRELARVLRLEGSVLFRGAVDHLAVFEVLRGARCFVQHSAVSSEGDSEGTPVAVLEAMSMGLPVVATRHGGIVDVVEEGVTGILVDEFDIPGMAEAMITLAHDGQKAAEMGTQGRNRLERYWTMEHSLERLADIIRQASER